MMTSRAMKHMQRNVETRFMKFKGNSASWQKLERRARARLCAVDYFAIEKRPSKLSIGVKRRTDIEGRLKLWRKRPICAKGCKIRRERERER